MSVRVLRLGGARTEGAAPGRDQRLQLTSIVGVRPTQLAAKRLLRRRPVPFPPSPASLARGLRRGLAAALRAEADIEDEHTIFLKTIIPSRKATKEHLGEESEDET